MQQLTCKISISISKMLKKLKSVFTGNLQPADSSLVGGKVAIHPLTKNPTNAWDKLKVKQIVEQVPFLDPSTPITEDKLRFVFLSDTHSQIEKREFHVPPGDVILHAGDFTSVGLPKAISEFDSYLGSLPHKRMIVIAGNHDLTLDMDMVQNQREKLLHQFNIQPKNFEEYLEKMNLKSSRELLKNCIYLLDSSVDVCGIKIYGSPWQPEFGGWGFNLARGAPCLEKWDKIPEDTDILMTHGPPIGHGDLCQNHLRAGCIELLTTIQTRVKPKYHLFGHIHEAYGITTDNQTIFMNGSNCTLRYRPDNPPIIFDVPIPEGHSKAELDNLPVNNLELTASKNDS